MRAVGYARVSSEDQARGGVSLDLQAEKIRGYASLHGLDLVELVSDPAQSAKSLNRPGLEHVLEMLDSGQAHGLVVFKLDRLTRNLGDWSSLIDRYFGESAGRSLMSVSESIDTGTAAGRLVLNVMMTVAQWERETIVERTRSAVGHKRAKGERIGQIPYGSKLGDDGRTLVADRNEQALRFVAEHLRQRSSSLREIASYFNINGYLNKRGGKWSHSSVAALLVSAKSPQEPAS